MQLKKILKEKGNELFIVLHVVFFQNDMSITINNELSVGVFDIIMIKDSESKLRRGLSSWELQTS